MINIALPKGRLADLSIEYFEYLGVNCEELKTETRKLIIEDPVYGARFFLVKPSDVPAYVEYGAADMGIAGRDSLLEERRNLYEVLNLGFGKCRMVLAGPEGVKLNEISHKRVGTKYPNIAREYFESKRMESAEIIKLSGSVELSPLAGLSELIVDIVESGRTLYENGLAIIETIADISARLVVNRVSMKMKSEQINAVIEGMRAKINDNKKNKRDL